MQLNGVSKVHSLGRLSEYEQTLIKAALPELAANIDKVCVLLFAEADQY